MYSLPVNVDCEGEDSGEGIDKDDIEELSDSSDDEDFEPPRLPLTPDQKDRHLKSLIQPKLESLLYLLFTQLPTNDNRGQFFTPIYHFLVLSSVRKKGEWATANTITRTIAAILFTGRLVFASKILQIAEESNVNFSG
jgi:hypothetical protein